MDYPREITIEEMPQGCILSTLTDVITVASPTDAIEIILTLQKMLRIQYPDYVTLRGYNYLVDNTATIDLQKTLSFVRGVYGPNQGLADATLKEMGLIK